MRRALAMSMAIGRGKSQTSAESPKDRRTVGPQPSAGSPAGKYLLLFGVALLIAIMVGAIARKRAEIRAVSTIPSNDRTQLYQRLLENLRFCKANQVEHFERFCSAEAEFVATFPECDDSCQELARGFIVRPTR
jgi:hypothetical protein